MLSVSTVSRMKNGPNNAIVGNGLRTYTFGGDEEEETDARIDQEGHAGSVRSPDGEDYT